MDVLSPSGHVVYEHRQYARAVEAVPDLPHGQGRVGHGRAASGRAGRDCCRVGMGARGEGGGSGVGGTTPPQPDPWPAITRVNRWPGQKFTTKQLDAVSGV